MVLLVLVVGGLLVYGAFMLAEIASSVSHKAIGLEGKLSDAPLIAPDHSKRCCMHSVVMASSSPKPASR